MKKVYGAVTALSLAAVFALGGCGNQKGAAPASEKEPESKDVVSAMEIDYANPDFEYEIPDTYKSTEFTTPQKNASDIISVSDANGATGVTLSGSQEEGNTTDYYLNAFVADSKLNIAVNSEEKVTVTDKNADGTEEDVPYSEEAKAYQADLEPIAVNSDKEEVLVVTVGDTSYNIHVGNDRMPQLETRSAGPAEDGVYSFAVDKFFFRVNTDEEIIYYRNLGCIDENYKPEKEAPFEGLMAENFKAVDAPEDGNRYYTYFVELRSDMRNSQGGYSSGEYVIMDENYKEIDYVTLMPNTDENHTHGEGYLDQHEFQLLGRDHWISLSYTGVFADNLPEDIEKNKDGGAYVHAGIIQEVQDGKVIHEYQTTDYPQLYETAQEEFDYAKTTGQPSDVQIQGAAEPVTLNIWSAGFMDYVHVNSVAVDPKDNNLIVSMRNQYAVYKIDRETGAIIWILGGKADQFGITEDQQFIGQHYAQYANKDIYDNDSVVTVYDNHTVLNPKAEHPTRVLTFTLDESAKKIKDFSAVNGKDLDGAFNDYTIVKNSVEHWCTHCGSYDIQANDSQVIGWGLNALMYPANVTTPILTEYNGDTQKVTFELIASRNPNYQSSELPFSYRVYKNAE